MADCKFSARIKIRLDEEEIISILEAMTGYDWTVDIEDGEYTFNGYVPGSYEYTPAVYYDKNMEGHPEEVDTRVVFNKLTLMKQLNPVLDIDIEEAMPMEVDA